MSMLDLSIRMTRVRSERRYLIFRTSQRRDRRPAIVPSETDQATAITTVKFFAEIKLSSGRKETVSSLPIRICQLLISVRFDNFPK